MQRLLFLCSTLLLLATLGGCAGHRPEPAAKPPAATLKTIVVMPVETVVDDTQPGPGQSKAELEKGRRVMDQLLAELLADHENISLLGPEKRDALAGEYAHCRTTAAVTICSRIGGDAALLLTLYRYQERQGSEYSVERPASVAFDYKLIQVSDGRTLCAGVFDETQQALFDNLLTFFTSSRRGFKWIRAKELAREGLAKKLAGCPYLAQKTKKDH